jgi:alkylation response protein AidB-like acyl-CoA dehydrogenase
LKWAKTYTAGVDKPVIHQQVVGYMLADIATKIEACRYLCWKAAHYLDMYDSDGHAIGAMSKIFPGETMFETVFQCMQVMGVSAVDKARNPIRCSRQRCSCRPCDGEPRQNLRARREPWERELARPPDPRKAVAARTKHVNDRAHPAAA